MRVLELAVSKVHSSPYVEACYKQHGRNDFTSFHVAALGEADVELAQNTGHCFNFCYGCKTFADSQTRQLPIHRSDARTIKICNELHHASSRAMYMQGTNLDRMTEVVPEYWSNLNLDRRAAPLHAKGSKL